MFYSFKLEKLVKIKGFFPWMLYTYYVWIDIIGHQWLGRLKPTWR